MKCASCGKQSGAYYKCWVCRQIQSAHFWAYKNRTKKLSTLTKVFDYDTIKKR